MLLASQIYGTHGGIPAYMRRLVDILGDYCSTRNGELLCVGMPGQSEPPSTEICGPRGTFVVESSKMRYVARCERILRSRPADLALAGYLGLAPLAWVLQTMGRVRSYSVILHGIEAWRRAGFLEGVAARAAAQLVSTTGFTARQFALQNRTKAERSYVVPLGLSDSNIPEAVVPSPHSNLLHVLTVGRLVACEGYKGVDTLIQALAVARARGFTIKLSVVGEGDDRLRLEEMTSHLGLGGDVKFLGAVRDDELQELYRRCSVFALPSKGEGFGIVFLEAMRWGKPCIGGNHGGIPEVIDDGKDGYLVEHGNVSQLAECLIALAERPDVRQRMGQSALQKIRDGYLYQHFRARWFHFLDEALRY